MSCAGSQERAPIQGKLIRMLPIVYGSGNVAPFFDGGWINVGTCFKINLINILISYVSRRRWSCDGTRRYGTAYFDGSVILIVERCLFWAA